MKKGAQAKSLTKKTLSVLLAVIMILSVMPMSGMPLGIFSSAEGANPAIPEDTVSDTLQETHFAHETPLELDDTTGHYLDDTHAVFVFDVPGTYFLVSEFTMDCDFLITADVKLCLNGNVLRANGDNSITVSGAGAKLEICDCDNETVHYFNANNRPWILKSNNSGQSVTGGVITGASISTPGKSFIKVENGAVMNIYKANIIGNSLRNSSILTSYQGLINVTNAEFNYYSGRLDGNYAGSYVYTDPESMPDPEPDPQPATAPDPEPDTDTYVYTSFMTVQNSDLFLGKNVTMNDNYFSSDDSNHSAFIYVNDQNPSDPTVHEHETTVYATNYGVNLTGGSSKGSVYYIRDAKANLYGDMDCRDNDRNQSIWHVYNISAGSEVVLAGNIQGVTGIHDMCRMSDSTLTSYLNINNYGVYDVYTILSGTATIGGIINDGKPDYQIYQSGGNTTITCDIIFGGGDNAIYVAGGTSVIDAYINDTFSAYGLVKLTTPETVKLGGRIVGNRTTLTPKGAVTVENTPVIIDKNLEISGNTVSGIPGNINRIVFETKEGCVGTAIFEEMLETAALQIDFYDSENARFTPSPVPNLVIDESLDKAELRSKLLGTKNKAEYYLDEHGEGTDDDEIIYVLHNSNTELRDVVEPTCTTDGFTGNIYR